MFCNVFFVALTEILTNESELADLNANLNFLLPSLMGLVPKNASNYPVITDRLKRFYLNGDDSINESNGHGFVQVNLCTAHTCCLPAHCT